MLKLVPLDVVDASSGAQEGKRYANGDAATAAAAGAQQQAANGFAKGTRPGIGAAATAQATGGRPAALPQRLADGKCAFLHYDVPLELQPISNSCMSLCLVFLFWKLLVCDPSCCTRLATRAAKGLKLLQGDCSCFLLTALWLRTVRQTAASQRRSSRCAGALRSLGRRQQRPGREAGPPAQPLQDPTLGPCP
jgi:hypothetical protein